jgi:putative hydrolase of the HAD superfamily
VPLLLVDLDNTLIDRAGAFDRWAREFAAVRGGSAADAGWLVAADRDGLEPRERLAAMIGERFRLNAEDEAGLLAELRGGLVRQIIPDDAVTRALRTARAAGWMPFVVTNGTVEQQERKLRHTGLDREVAGWVISEGAGMRKPDPSIFRFAAAQAGQPLDGAWMIGDSAEADINGARNAGVPGIWLHRGRPWPLTDCEPSYVADSFPHAVEIVLAVGSATGAATGTQCRPPPPTRSGASEIWPKHQDRIRVCLFCRCGDTKDTRLELMILRWR